jgi:hypothetical protein
VEEVQEEAILEVEDEEDENEENLLNESEEEVEDSQESIELLEDIHLPRTLQEMQDFWVNQHVESSHRIRPLPTRTFGTNKGVQQEINPSNPLSPNTSTGEFNTELLPEELHQLRERWRVSSPLKQYMRFDKDLRR